MCVMAVLRPAALLICVAAVRSSRRVAGTSAARLQTETSCGRCWHRADVDLARRAGGAAALARSRCASCVCAEPADVVCRPCGGLDAAVHRGAEPALRRQRRHRPLGRRAADFRGAVAAAWAPHGASVVATIEPGSRRAAAVLLVATRNEAPPAIVATILACLVVSVVTIGRYVAWRRSCGRNPPQAG